MEGLPRGRPAAPEAFGMSSPSTGLTGGRLGSAFQTRASRTRWPRLLRMRGRHPSRGCRTAQGGPCRGLSLSCAPDICPGRGVRVEGAGGSVVGLWVFGLGLGVQGLGVWRVIKKKKVACATPTRGLEYWSLLTIENRLCTPAVNTVNLLEE